MNRMPLLLHPSLKASPGGGVLLAKVGLFVPSHHVRISAMHSLLECNISVPNQYLIRWAHRRVMRGLPCGQSRSARKLWRWSSF